MNKDDKSQQELLDDALLQSDQLLHKSLQEDEVRRSRIRWFSYFVIIVIVLLVLTLDFRSETKLEFLTEAVDVSENGNAKIDQSQCSSIEWQEAIEQHMKLYKKISQHRRMTLFRVLLPGAPRETSIQLKGSKLIGIGETSGGGLYRVVPNGGFVVIDHKVSSLHEGKDFLEIGNENYHRATFYFDSPAQGRLGICGDIILSKCKSSEMGNITFEVQQESEFPLDLNKLLIGPVVVGGDYGKEIPFRPNFTCTTLALAPGVYKTLLPDFDLRKSRWNIKVHPGKTTHVRLLATSQKNIKQVSVATLPIKLER